MLESQNEQNEMHLHKLCMLKIHFWARKVALKMHLFLFIPTWFVFSSLLGMAHMSNED